MMPLNFSGRPILWIPRSRNIQLLITKCCGSGRQAVPILLVPTAVPHPWSVLIVLAVIFVLLCIVQIAVWAAVTAAVSKILGAVFWNKVPALLLEDYRLRFLCFLCLWRGWSPFLLIFCLLLPESSWLALPRNPVQKQLYWFMQLFHCWGWLLYQTGRLFYCLFFY